jgi:prepilin-type N-terminal cleavage/methylation domain-containing protein/prepilin-type processing-associated H-X9-DG protein
MTALRGERRRRRRDDCGRAFTLVELLVVIGIIALLIAILLPALSRARENGNIVKCLSNMRQIAQAQQIYANENKGYSLPAGYLNMPVDSNGSNADNYATILVNLGLLNAPSIATLTSPPTGQPTVFTCPTGIFDLVGVQYSSGTVTKPAPTSRKDALGARPWRTQSWSTKIIIDTYYGINAQWQGIGKTPYPAMMLPGDATAGAQGYNYLRKMGSIGRAADMVFIFDGTFYDVDYDANRINARHSGQSKTNIVFYDGHGATVQTAELPGGIGDANTPANLFKTLNNAANGTFAIKWRLDQP